MTTVSDLASNLESLNISDIALRAIERTESILIDDITEQLFEGTDATGNKISPEYALDEYADLKHSMNPKAGYGIPDLKLTGLFYSKLSAKIEGPEILFDAPGVEYAPLLGEKYGDQIFEPSEKTLDEYTYSDVLPEIAADVEEQTGLVFK